MRVLSHGIPFCCDESPLFLYDGPHEIRYLGNYDRAYYQYDPLKESASDIIGRIARDWEPDLLLCWIPEVHPPPTGIEDAPVPTVALVSDWNLYYPLLNVNLARYDLTLCDKPGVNVLRSDLVSPHHLFPLYSQITPLHKPHPTGKDIDVVFVGNLNHAAHPRRARYLERLAKLSGRYRIVIATGVFGEAYTRLLSRARIVFNHSVRGELNLRVFETIACGSLAFLEEDNQEVWDWLEPDREVVLYNETNLEERIQHFIERRDEADAIAARGHARAAGFAGENRFSELIEWAAAQPGSGRPFRQLPRLERDYQSLLMYGFSRWKVYRAIEEDLITRLAKAAPGDPRVWTVIGQHLLNAYSKAGEPDQRRERYTKAFMQAHRLDPSSAPRALNAASVFRIEGNEDGELHYLQATLDAESLSGADFLLGTHQSAFWSRWQSAAAYGAATLDMIRAEAHIRLARILARNGSAAAAEEHLHLAERLDPANTGGVRLLSDIQWAAGRHAHAVDTLRARLSDLPFDLDARRSLIERLIELGEVTEARALEAETRLITSAHGSLPSE